MKKFKISRKCWENIIDWVVLIAGVTLVAISVVEAIILYILPLL